LILFDVPGTPDHRAYTIIFWVLALFYPVGRLLGLIWLSRLIDALTLVGSFWLAVMLYLFLGSLTADLVSLFAWILGLFSVDPDISILKQALILFSAGITLFLLVYGLLNARNPRIRWLSIVLDDKTMEGNEEISIAVASDLHLGTIVARRMARKIIQRINSVKPDLILLAGDVVDEDLGPVIRFNLGECLRELQAPMGVYAITGNHEYIGGVEKACQYLEEHGIRVLRDEWIRLGNGIYLAGREDRDKYRFTGRKRRPLTEILEGVDYRSPVILLDHQPFSLHEAEDHGIDLSLSGHTHHGQLWPISYVTRAIYEVSWGYLKRGNTHYYISCGAGTWGPPVRTGNRPEILEIRLKTRAHNIN
jgi:hypothetical protein